ncbi:MAG: hypothetical protein J6S23_01565 [Clostridia bacterium]|nr:hypothetical protein [Clostridia bacterium]
MASSEGYIKLYRKMMKWGWYTDTNTKCVFLHLLFLACYEPCYFKGVYLEPGQIITTVKEISDGTGISVRSVRTSLERLKSTNELTIETSPKFSLIKLNNYADYQGNDKGSDKQVTNERQTNDKPSYSKEIKEVKEVKNIDRAKKFCPPTLEEIKAYCLERNNTVDAEKFFDYYEANGWVQGKGKPVKDWKACVRTWERNGFDQTVGNKNQKETYTEHGAYW